MRSLIAAFSLLPFDNSDRDAASVGGVDCAVIRRLSAFERLYWIAHLGLSAADIRAIKKTCNIK